MDPQGSTVIIELAQQHLVEEIAAFVIILFNHKRDIAANLVSLLIFHCFPHHHSSVSAG